jgi:hypothetical protein
MIHRTARRGLALVALLVAGLLQVVLAGGPGTSGGGF